MPIIHKIAGPPGTGKTTKLLEIVNDLLETGIHPARILYTTFTKAGANEARNRAISKFSLTENQLPYFRTLHSICYRLMLDKAQIMTPSDWVNFGRAYHVYITVSRKEEANQGTSKGDHMLSIISLARNFEIPLKQAYLGYPDNHICTLAEVEYLAHCLTNYKRETGKLDFTDLLELVVEKKPLVEVDYVIGDEMQDLTPLQWKVLAVLSRTAKEVWYAGDDDQAIYEWAGAKASLFTEAPGELQVLGQSYRIPQTVHSLAEKVSARISKRIDKKYAPRDFAGKVNILEFDKVDMSEGKWLILVRNAVFAETIQGYCLQHGWNFTGQNPWISEKAKRAVITWNRLTSGEPCMGSDLKNMADNLVRGGIKYGFKQMFDLQIHDDDILTETYLRENFGLVASGTWKEVIRLTGTEIEFLASLERRKELSLEPRIEFSTIHNAKGRECDNVVVCVDQTRKTKQGEIDNPDAEHRVWYVGITRAKKTLTLLLPLTSSYYEFPV